MILMTLVFEELSHRRKILEQCFGFFSHGRHDKNPVGFYPFDLKKCQSLYIFLVKTICQIEDLTRVIIIYEIYLTSLHMK